MSDLGQVSSIRRLRRYRPRKRMRPRYKGLSFNSIVPNLLTMLGLCAGLTAMRFGLEGRFGPAAVAITVAGAIDGLDGRLARLLKATSRFGAEFDSLSDFLCFGVAPSFLIYLWSLQRGGAYGYAPCLMFTVLHGASAGAVQRVDGWSAQAGLRLQLLHRGAGARWGRNCVVPDVPWVGGQRLGRGMVIGRGALSAAVRGGADQHGGAAGVDPANLELQELQGAIGVRLALVAGNGGIHGGSGR